MPALLWLVPLGVAALALVRKGSCLSAVLSKSFDARDWTAGEVETVVEVEAVAGATLDDDDLVPAVLDR